MKERCAGTVPTPSLKASKSPKLSPVTGRTKKRVKFVTSPMWKGVSSVAGGSGKRSVLRVLPASAKNSKLLVGAGSSQVASFGKSTKPSFPQNVPAEDKENTVAVKLEAVPVVASKAVQTDMESHQPTAAPTTGVTDGSLSGDVVSLEEYWRELAEQRRLALADTLMENEELHAEVALLKCTVRELEVVANDATYFTMMHRVCTANTTSNAEGTDEAKTVTV